jgi:hypothetical protein
VVPLLLNFFDDRVNSHYFFSYDVARAFITGQEETNTILPTLIGYKPLIKKIREKTEQDASKISKEISRMNEQRPDVAAAVKTRQAARSILNTISHTVEQMKKKGVLDDHNARHLLEVRYVPLHFPYHVQMLFAVGHGRKADGSPALPA